MKKRNLLQLGLMVTVSSGMSTQAQQKRSVASVDPIVDLRVPRSLFEELHEGMNDVYLSLESASGMNVEDMANILADAQSGLDQLSSRYDSLINTTRNNQVYNDDKEFLQRMIDRIDQLLEELEGEKGIPSDELQTVRSLCQSLKRQIAA